MEDKLVTLSILTYSKAQILKHILGNEGIEAYIHNVNLIQPVVSSGVRLRIKESDLPRALKLVESSVWLSEDITPKKNEEKKERKRIVLIPVDFSDYSLKACELGFHFAKKNDAEIVLLHAYFTPVYASSLPYGDVFNYQIAEEESIRDMVQLVHTELNKLSDKIKKQISTGDLPDIKYTCLLRDGVPEDEILRYAKENNPIITIMGTRGKNQKDVELIGSVTAEVIDRSQNIVLAIPEETPFKTFDSAKKIAFVTNFDQRDLIAFDNLINSLKEFEFSVSLIHLAQVKDTWDEIKLAGIKDYFSKQYPGLEIFYDVVPEDNILSSFDKYIHEKKVDVIAITSRKRNIFARLFNPSIARKMIFHTDTPLLVING